VTPGVGRAVMQVRVGSNRYMDMEGVECNPTIEEVHQAGQEQGHSLVMVAVRL